jgi:spermidine/putrescine transport system permease protein
LFVCWYAFTTPDGHFTLANFQEFSKPRYLGIIVRSLKLALYCTALCLVIGYPTAWFLSGRGFNNAQSLVVLILLPMWMNLLLRTYAMMTLLDDNGVLNAALQAIGLRPIKIIGTEGAVLMGLVYNYLPFMVLPIYTVLKKMDYSVIEAAEDLGCNPLRVMTRVVIPLSVPGIVSGVTMVFMPAVTSFAISTLLSNGKLRLAGDLIDYIFNQSSNPNRWNIGSSFSLMMLVLILVSIGFLRKVDPDSEGGGMW